MTETLSLAEILKTHKPTQENGVALLKLWLWEQLCYLRGDQDPLIIPESTVPLAILTRFRFDLVSISPKDMDIVKRSIDKSLSRDQEWLVQLRDQLDKHSNPGKPKRW